MPNKKINPPKSSKKLFEIGQIVSSKSNHLSDAEQYQHIWLAGDQNYTTPLMVITEILINVSQNIDEVTGEDKSQRNKYRYKCMYFSNKQLKFEENWFYQEELHDTSYEIPQKNLALIKPGKRVVFKTNQIEVGKRKSFLEQENKKKNQKSASLLTFSSPVFIVAGFKVVIKKEPEFDLITGEVKHEYPSKAVKIKFFNSILDKFSEFIVPVEILTLAEIEKEDILSKIIESKEQGFAIKLELKTSIHLCIIDSVLFISDDYLINCTNFFTKEEETYKLSELDNVDMIFKYKTLSSKIYPSVVNPKGTIEFNYIGIPTVLESLAKQSNKKNRDTNTPLGAKILHIRYTNTSNKYTERYIIPLYVATADVPNYEKEGETIKRQYLKAFCLLRNSERFFRADRIMTLDAIEDSQFFTVANDIWKGL
jgi:hypothetical protein